MGMTERNSENGVFELLSELSSSFASKHSHQNGISLKRSANKMRTYAYEIILKKTTTKIPSSERDPMVDLLSYYLVAQQSAKNVAEYRRCVQLKKVISTIRHKDFGEIKDNVNSVLKFLVSLTNTVKDDLSSEMYQKPFSFGLFDEMLPKPPQEAFGSPQPYSYFPPHVFDLPFSLKRQEGKLDHHKSQTYTEYTVESFDSQSYLGDTGSQLRGTSDVKTFLSPMSLASMTSTHLSPYSESVMFRYPRLTAPRDLQIPSSINEPNIKISFNNTSVKSEVNEVFRANTDEDSLDIWELATQLDKELPDNIWELVSKMPPSTERQLIASSSRELGLWHRLYAGRMTSLHVISEKTFIRHLMYLLIGIETSSFPFSEESNRFYMKQDLILEGISLERLRNYVTDLLLIGTYYRSLYRFAFNQSLEDHFHTKGLVYEAAREVVRQYLLEFRLLATEIYEECTKSGSEDLNCMPTLLQILHHMEPLKYEIETVVSIYRTNEPEVKSSLPYGAELMSYLFNEISLVTHTNTSRTMFTSLFSICKVYFKFIEKFIFEGELDDTYNEFFIRKDSQFVNCRSKRYWDKGFHITQSLAVPEFLRPLAKYILLCGKSLRLLKMCNPNDPLVVLISSDHPSIECWPTFEECSRYQSVLDVYRTRCLFVGGERASFHQLLLNKEAERKAFAEMASVKQAETMEKIVAERKRLAQLIIAEKQHSLRVLEAAMAEAKAAKLKTRQRERRRSQLEREAERASDQVDSKLRDDERNKIMEYYSKLNMEVEKSKIHTEWKIKRLQLDQSRIQLLSTEERNLKREKLELEHQKNGEMAMSITQDYNTDIESKDEGDNLENATVDETAKTEKSTQDPVTKSQTSSAVLSVICNAAKSIFSVRKTADDKNCDNKQNLDAQGNIVCGDTEVNSNDNATVTSSGVIGNDINEDYDNIQFLKMRHEALLNKQKVMSHEFGKTDKENNQMKYPLIKTTNIDEENNMQEWSQFEEARRNKLKVLGDEFGLKPEVRHVSEPKTDAQKEALINKQKVLGVEYNLPLELTRKEPANIAQEEALINKQKVLGVEYNLPLEITRKEPANIAQEEALINKQKVLGVEYNLPLEITRKEPANIAQEEALRNKIKVLGSDYDTRMPEVTPRSEIAKRSGLTLNLKPYGEPMGSNLGLSPNTGAVTPGELFPRLDLETPTTADVPLEGAMTGDAFTPRSEFIKDIESTDKDEKQFRTSDGFNFPVVEDEDAVETVSEVNTESPGNSPSKSIDSEVIASSKHYSIFNLLDGTYSLEEFDPFGVKDFKKYSKDFFSCRMDSESSCYTHPAITMEKVKKPPYTNIFATHFKTDDDKDRKIDSNNIATLSACLQRSVMLPLTYQLEVVNNSILTYFLVNLDMYEHLRSLKDYFFLMDGEFSRSICHNLFTKLEKTVNPQELLNFATLHNILDKALGSSISHVHKFSENLSFSLTDVPLSLQHSSPDVLQCLALSYQVRWPLNIILSQEASLRYARVFQFLLKMRRIFWALSEDFEALKLAVKLSKQHSRRLIRSPQYITVQIYRHIMASMIRALDNYIVTTCILTSWTEFESDLKKARTLDDLYDCHVVYIKKVLFRCLLNNRSTPVMKLLNDMFTVILKFSRVLKAGEWHQLEPNGPFTHSSFSQLDELYHLFEKLAKYLHKVVTKLMECGYQRHLVELLAMVNLNGYYEPGNIRDEHNISAVSTN
ncbi:hypothetical protein evm_010778 [Chilo suppressalis]|nr:hypothetical protein evm_010778 [Chilo suppressalis]